MTERKPPDLSVESWIDKQIREATERGEFDNLPGAGKPLPPGKPGDELWWVRQKMQREGVRPRPARPRERRPRWWRRLGRRRRKPCE